MKGIVAALFAVGALVALDQHYSRGQHTETALDMLRAIRRSFFGW